MTPRNPARCPRSWMEYVLTPVARGRGTRVTIQLPLWRSLVATTSPSVTFRIRASTHAESLPGARVGTGARMRRTAWTSTPPKPPQSSSILLAVDGLTHSSLLRVPNSDPPREYSGRGNGGEFSEPTSSRTLSRSTWLCRFDMVPPSSDHGGIPFTQVPTTGCGGVSSSDHGYP